MELEDYFKNLRAKIGHDEILMPGVNGVLYDETGDKILLQKRADTNMWGLPGGMMNLGETAPQSLVREFLEETGLEVRVTKLLAVHSDFHITWASGDQAQPIGITFLVEKVGGKLDIHDEETLDLAYVPLYPVPKMFNSQHQDTIDQLAAGTESWFF